MRRALAAVVLAVALVAGACGNGDGDGTASGDLPLLPSSGGASGGGADAESSGAARSLAADNAGSSQASTMVAPAEPYQPIEYRLADDIEPMGGKAAAYRLEAVIDEERVRKLADAFGVEGDIEDENGSWSVGGDGGRGLYVDSGGGFNYFDDSASARSASAEASASCSSDGECQSVTPAEPPKPKNLPTDDEAKKIAADAFDKAGVDVDEESARVDRSDYHVGVAFTTTIDGKEADGVMPSVALGDGGEIVYLTGWLANPSKIGDYPLVETKEAYDRWTSGMGGGGRVGIAVDTAEPAQTEPAEGAPEPAVDRPMPAPDAGGEAPPSEPAPTLPPKIVEIDRVERVLLVEYPRCPGDPMYLVPAYRLSAGDEVYATIPAVSEEYLQSSVDSGDEPVSSDDAEFEPCPNTGVGDTEPGREPDAPPATDGGGDSGYPPVTIE